MSCSRLWTPVLARSTTLVRGAPGFVMYLAPSILLLTSCFQTWSELFSPTKIPLYEEPDLVASSCICKRDGVAMRCLF